MAPSDGLTDNRSQPDDEDPFDKGHLNGQPRAYSTQVGGIREQLYEEMTAVNPRQHPQQIIPLTGHDVFKAPPVVVDNVVQPPHYARFKIQPLEFVLANNLGYVEGCVIKYVCRWPHKNGIEDLKKAREFLDKYITTLEQRS